VKDEIGGALMTNEEFQRIVLEELKSLKEGQRSLEKGQRSLEKGQRSLEEGQREIKKELKAITEQTADLTEFREETNVKLDTIIEENEILKELIGKHEVDIRRLQRRIV
jgi:translation initiation factor 2B subunit (eIF-2B alpha/beta/delta family)